MIGIWLPLGGRPSRRTRKALEAQGHATHKTIEPDNIDISSRAAPEVVALNTTKGTALADIVSRLSAENDRLRFENRNLIVDLGKCRAFNTTLIACRRKAFPEAE